MPISPCGKFLCCEWDFSHSARKGRASIKKETHQLRAFNVRQRQRLVRILLGVLRRPALASCHLLFVTGRIQPGALTGVED